MKVFDLKNKQEYLREVMELEFKEWSSASISEMDEKVKKKIDKYYEYVDDKLFCKLILLDEENLVGFISIFPHDGDIEKDLSPWYATMYVKKEYRGRGCSRILNDAILEEARKRGIETIYLKTELINYYEKFGAVYIKDLSDKERLLKFEL